MKSEIVLKKPPILYKETQEIIKNIQTIIDGDFLSYWISEKGTLDQEDTYPLYKILNKKQKKDTLFFFVKSDGGSGKGALRIIHLLRNYYKKIIAFVPLDCASAATMLVLGADKIQMGPLAYLSAIDTSITHQLSPIDKKYNNKVSVSQNELDRVLKLWDIKSKNTQNNPYEAIYEYVHPLVIGAVDRASSLSIKLTTEILSYHLEDEEKAKEISNHLNSSYPSHIYPITLKEAIKIGLNVTELESNMNGLLLKLNELYSEMAQKAHTDYDEVNYHDNEILTIIESVDNQIFYQREKDWHYLTEERRYITMNDESSWRKIEVEGDDIKVKKFYVS